MMKRSVWISLAVTMFASLAVLPTAHAGGGTSRSGTATPEPVKPDAWVRLCGAGGAVGCREARFIARTPYKGNNIYNRTGWHQTASGYVDEGADIRFWVAVQNDGTNAATLLVDGCNGMSPRGGPWWEVRQVLHGQWKFPQYGHGIVVTDEFRNGTLALHFPAGSHERRYLTIDLWEHVRGVGNVFKCPIKVSWKGHPGVQDTVVARAITY